MSTLRTPRGFIPIAPVKGRGATSNRASRFDDWERAPDGDYIDDALAREDDAAPSAPRTTVSIETARSIIARNDSPDIPFDQSINPYRGCEHGCIYCYARPTHAYLGLSPGLDFETRLYAKTNAAELLERELARPGYVPRFIALGANTDPYQPIERKLAITRSLLEVLMRCNHPVGITTKSALVERDLDLLAPMAQKGLARVFMSIATLDHEVSRTLEPRTSAPRRRMEAVRALAAAGVPVGVMTAPIIPAITDMSLETVLEAAAAAGADSAGYTILRLPLEVRDLFVEWLDAHYPQRREHVMSILRQMRGGRDYDSRFGARMRGEGLFAELIARRFALATRRLGLNARRYEFDLTRFKAPVREGPQRSLF
jgi:DNA repair photolyase